MPKKEKPEFLVLTDHLIGTKVLIQRDAVRGVFVPVKKDNTAEEFTMVTVCHTQGDGRVVQFAVKENVIQVARALGVEIGH